MQGYEPLKAKLEAKEYVSEETPLLQLFKDGNPVTNKKDWAIVQYLLGRMVDLNQKQLDGMYNIPDGANFWIPYNDQLLAMLTAYATGGAGTSTGGVSTSTDMTNKIAQMSPEEYDAMQIESLKARGYGVLPPSSVKKPTSYYTTDKYGIMQEQAGQVYGEGKPYPGTGRDFGASSELASSAGISVWDSIKAALEKMLSGAFTGTKNPFEENPLLTPKLTPQLGASATPGTLPNMGLLGILSSILSSQKMDVAPQTKLDIKMDSKIQLVVDGRTLASIVKTYLMADLIKAQSGFGTKTQSIVITQM
jgi:hypothetical protein